MNLKIAVVTHQLLAQNQPTYLCNLLTFRGSNKRSRSANHSYFYQLQTKTDFSASVFSSAAPGIWNSLPQDSLTLD
jgi:hypothetical protein